MFLKTYRTKFTIICMLGREVEGLKFALVSIIASLRVINLLHKRPGLPSEGKQ